MKIIINNRPSCAFQGKVKVIRKQVQSCGQSLGPASSLNVRGLEVWYEGLNSQMI